MTYMIETAHQKGECLSTLDAQLNTGPQILGKFYFGCKSGDHTGYALVDAKDEKEVLSLIPEFLRERSRIIKVEAFTPDDIKAAHTGGEEGID